WAEYLPWVIGIGAFFLLPEYLSLGARVLIYILFALSLDLILGYAGIITLGHSAFFGLGAYTAGVLSAKYGLTDPFLQLLAAAAAAALLGITTGAVILRTKALTLLMLTLAITSILLEIANKATWLTGGADGLSGVKTDPILGMFRFDIFGKTAFIYCLLALFVGWLVVPVVYLIAQDYLAKQYPEYWYFGIGVLLIVVVLFARGGILGLIDQMRDKWLPALSRQTGSARASAR